MAYAAFSPPDTAKMLDTVPNCPDADTGVSCAPSGSALAAVVLFFSWTAPASLHSFYHIEVTYIVFRLQRLLHSRIR